MKQHLAKSLLMAGALIASYPLLAQQAQPVQQAQPMPAPQTMPSDPTMPAGQLTQDIPSAAQSAQADMPAARDPYAKGSSESVQRGIPPSVAQANPAMDSNPNPMQDAASMTLAPDALGTRLGQRNVFLDGA